MSSSQKFWRNLCEAMDRHDLADEPRFATYKRREAHYFELVGIAEAEFARKPAREREKLLTAFDVPYAPVLTMSGLAAHPQTEWLGLLEPERDGFCLVRPPWRFGGARPTGVARLPGVGQHCREIAAEVYDDARIGELIAAGVLFADT